MGTAFNQIGISLGLTAAPLVVAWIAPHYGWRATFIFSGALGLIWVPLWLITAKRVPAHPAKTVRSTVPIVDLLSDRRLWGLMISTVFIMSLYTLWTNWTTLYFVEQWHMSQEQANARFRVDSASGGDHRRIFRRLDRISLDPRRTRSPRRAASRVLDLRHCLVDRHRRDSVYAQRSARDGGHLHQFLLGDLRVD